MRIDLADFRSPDSRVYAGRGRGERVREKLDLDAIDSRADEQVEVHVPLDVFSINTSFFLGMFGPSIRRLGDGGFRNKYRFTGKSIGRVYERGIREALTTDSPFSGTSDT